MFESNPRCGTCHYEQDEITPYPIKAPSKRKGVQAIGVSLCPQCSDFNVYGKTNGSRQAKREMARLVKEVHASINRVAEENGLPTLAKPSGIQQYF